MRRLIARASAVVAVSAVAGAIGVSAAGAFTQALHPAKVASLAAAHRQAVPGATLWVKRYSSTGKGSDVASAVAVSPGGGRVFVTGDSHGAATFDVSDYLTAAYNAATGVRLWTARYIGLGSLDYAGAVAVSPDGATVFVTGASYAPGSNSDYATVAYRAADGTQLWVARYNGPGNEGDFAAAVSVARDGTKVFVTGTSFDSADETSGMATVAYGASDGAQLWVDRIDGPGGNTGGSAIVSPGGNRVFVTGEFQSKADNAEYGTVAYNATTGARLWARRFTGRGGSHYDYTTLAYSVRTGARLWLKRYNSGGIYGDFAHSVAVSPGGTVLVTGEIRGFPGPNTGDYATVAYSPGGHQLWARRYSGPGNHSDAAHAVAAPGNGRVYVTGTSRGGSATGDDYATVAYNVRTGALVWVRRYNGPASGVDSATALAARGGRVFVTGGSAGTISGDDYATIAYNG